MPTNKEPRILVLVIKSQGENRERGADGRLHETQTALKKVVISRDGHIVWFGPRGSSISQCQRSAEEIFGPLEWIGYPELLRFAGELKTTVELKAVAVVREGSHNVTE